MALRWIQAVTFVFQSAFGVLLFAHLAFNSAFKQMLQSVLTDWRSRIIKALNMTEASKY